MVGSRKGNPISAAAFCALTFSVLHAEDDGIAFFKKRIRPEVPRMETKRTNFRRASTFRSHHSLDTARTTDYFACVLGNPW